MKIASSLWERRRLGARQANDRRPGGLGPMLREYQIRDPNGSRSFFITTSTRLWLALLGPIVVWRLAGGRAALVALASSLAVLLAVVAAVLVASVLPPRIQLGVIVAGVVVFLGLQSFAGIRLVKRAAFRRRWLVKRL